MPFIVFYLLLAAFLDFAGSGILYRLLTDKIFSVSVVLYSI
jgi:hypothetical protein